MRLRIHIRKHELGLRFRHGDFRRVLAPGAYLVPGRLTGRDAVEVVSKLATKFEHGLLDVLVDEPQIAERATVVDLADSERALVWKAGRLGWILGPGRHAFWSEPFALEVERFDAGEVRFQHPKIDAVLAHPDAKEFFSGVEVDAHMKVLVFRDGVHVATFGPGRYVFWKHSGRISWQAVDLRERVLDVAGQEIMTADRVSLRINLMVGFQVEDPVAALSAVSEYEQALYREAQLALRAAVGQRTLDKLLADKDAVGGEVRQALARRAGEFGVAVRGVGLRDVILPGDMKVLLNQVIEAQKQAEANLIRRREETAAARSQANTARLLAENPVLARLKELELLQEILAGTRATFVVGGGRGEILEQVRQLVARREEDP